MPQVIAYRTTPPGLLLSLYRSACVICFGYDLFLSHRHANRDYALALWPRLEERGLITCFDQHDFHVGERLHLTMRRTVSSSSTLLLLDTTETRCQRDVDPMKEEVDAAVKRGLPIVPIREKGLPQNPWPGVDADDELLYAKETREAFDAGVPSEDVIVHIVRRHCAIRVRTWFFWASVLIAAALVMFGTFTALQRWFDYRVGLVYAAMQRPSSSIDDADRAFTALDASRLFRWFGERFHARDMDALRRALDGLWIKPIDPTPLTSSLRPSDEQKWLFTNRFSAAKNVGLGSDGTVVAIAHGAVIRVRNENRVACSALSEPAVRVAVTPAADRVVALTTTSIYLWRTDECANAPGHRRLPVPITEDDIVRLAFGNNGRSVLIALKDRLLRFNCAEALGCDDPSVTPLSTIYPEAAPDERICAADISPTRNVVAASIGTCNFSDETVCLLAGAIDRSAKIQVFGLAFDPPGSRLVVVTNELTQWLVEATGSGQRGPDTVALGGTELTRIAFDPSGNSMAVLSQGAGWIVLALYSWPEMAWLQTVPLPVDANEMPEYLLFGPTIELLVGNKPLAFDVRHRPRGA
jgi:TIR domain-containing protein